MKPSTIALPERPRLRVLTMNIWGFTEPYQKRQRLLRKGIQRLGPDLMAFQEAGFDGERHQVAELLDGLGYHVFHQFEHANAKWEDGCCVASRWPMNVVEVLDLHVTHRSSDYPYVAMAVRVVAPKPIGPMLFVCAKPAWQLDQEHERELQAVALARMIARRADRKGFPTILAGDFDATPDSASIRFLTGKQSLQGRSVHYLDCWEQAGDGTAGHTWTHQNPSARAIMESLGLERHHARRIDYIFLGSPHDYENCARVRRCRVVLNRPEGSVWPSDHYAVYAEIDCAAP